MKNTTDTDFLMSDMADIVFFFHMTYTTDMGKYQACSSSLIPMFVLEVKVQYKINKLCHL